MTDKYEHIDELIAKLLAGEASEQEATLVREWAKESSANQEEFDAMQSIWTGIADVELSDTSVFDTKKALSQVKQRIKPAGSARRVSMRPWMAAAAALVVVLFAWYFLQPDNSLEPVELFATETPVSDTLTDGSAVLLNRNSRLAFSSEQSGKVRKARLKGEAYFDVQTDSTRTFQVEVGALEIEVLGTAFNVDNLTDSLKVVVTVTEGRVALKAGGEELQLTKGESAEYSVTEKVLQKLQTKDPNALSYQTRSFVFESTPLRLVLLRLEAVYGQVVVVSNPALMDCELTAEFEDMELDRILELIADSFSLEYKEEDSVYMLDGEQCDF